MPPTSPQGQPGGGGEVEVPASISIVLSTLCSASWRHLVNGGHLNVLPPGTLLVVIMVIWAGEGAP